MPTPRTRQMLSAAQVARIAGLSRASVYRAIERGELRASRLCGRLRIEPAEVEAWKQRTVVRPRRPDTPMFDPANGLGSEHEGTFLAELRRMDRS